MTDEPLEPTIASRRAPPPTPWTRARMEGHFRGAAFVVLLALGAIATLRAYLALEDAITTWLRPQWIPVAQAAFSLVILAVCVWLIRSWVIARGD